MNPKHIGIILDGNRRFAKQLMKKPWEGHRYGLKKGREVLEWAIEKKIKYITAYTLSLENLESRPKAELDYILKQLRNEMKEILGNKNHPVHKHQIKVNFIGRLSLLPDDLQDLMKTVEESSKDYSKHFLNLAVAYGGQQEIVDATKKIVEKCMKGVIKPEELNEELLKHNLYTNGTPYPDLIIRSGGEKRLSNFLPFQSAYSELIFTDKNWPELEKEDFSSFLEEFLARKRRFGK
mgnify:CR=1 FL=1